MPLATQQWFVYPTRFFIDVCGLVRFCLCRL